MRVLSRIIAICAILIPLVGCDTAVGSPSLAAEQPSGAISDAIESELRSNPTPTLSATQTEVVEITVSPKVSDHDGATVILLGDDVIVDGPGVSVDGSIVTIAAGGSYVLRGSFTGQVVVDYPEKDPVELLLDGVSITSPSGSSIAILDAKDAAIILMDGTDNLLVDGEGYVFADGQDEPNATLYSKSDLTIGGPGSLVIEANYKHGINGKDDLVIADGSITVSAVADGIRGKDSLVIAGGAISVIAGDDGLVSSNNEDADKGVVQVLGGALTIDAGDDGIQAESSVEILAGDIQIITAGGAGDLVQSPSAGGRGGVTNVPSDISAKGLQAGTDVRIAGGDITVDALDDALHSNGSMTVSGGALTIRSGDDGLHADDTLTISGGEITVSRCYEGIESGHVTIEDGNIHLVANDDGIGVSGGDARLDITGGYIAIDSQGDGVDANGSAYMSGGVLIISGPTSSRNGALDADRGFTVSGGVIVAASALGMAQAPSDASPQNSLMANLAQEQKAGTLLAIESSEGELLICFAPHKAYQAVVVSSPDIADGLTYTAYTGGKATGEAMDGVYLNASCAPGAEAGSVRVSGAVSVIGEARGMGPGGRGGRGAPGPPGQRPGP